MTRIIDLTEAEWHSLALLPKILDDNSIPDQHKAKLIQVGLAAEKTGKLVATFEGRLRLRQRKES